MAVHSKKPMHKLRMGFYLLLISLPLGREHPALRRPGLLPGNLKELAYLLLP